MCVAHGRRYTLGDVASVVCARTNIVAIRTIFFYFGHYAQAHQPETKRSYQNRRDQKHGPALSGRVLTRKRQTLILLARAYIVRLYRWYTVCSANLVHRRTLQIGWNREVNTGAHT